MPRWTQGFWEGALLGIILGVVIGLFITHSPYICHF